MVKNKRGESTSASEESKIHPQLASLALPIASLVHDPRNARRHDAYNVRMIAESLREHGQRKPIVAQRASDRLIVRAGNGTLEAARSLGWGMLAVLVVDEDDRSASRFALRDNRTAELAGWDDQALQDAIRECSDSQADIASLGWLPAEPPKIEHQFDVDEIEPPALSSGERAPFRQMTFLVHDDQHEMVETAIIKAKSMGLAVSDINENANANALAAICTAFVNG